MKKIILSFAHYEIINLKYEEENSSLSEELDELSNQKQNGEFTPHKSFEKTIQKITKKFPNLIYEKFFSSAFYSKYGFIQWELPAYLSIVLRSQTDNLGERLWYFAKDIIQLNFPYETFSELEELFEGEYANTDRYKTLTELIYFILNDGSMDGLYMNLINYPQYMEEFYD